MLKTKCAVCRHLRTLLFALLLGVGGGLTVIWLGGSDELSMLATFAGGIAPLMWSARQNRISGQGDR